MRFLHTADWHAGKLLRGRPRIAELEAACAEILDIAVREKVDCLLFAGDLFDSHAPPPEAERLVYEVFAEVLRHRIAAVIIGGNHDHPTRLGALRRLLEPLSLYIRPEPVSAKDGGVIRFERRGEAVNIAVLPFVSERKLVDICKMIGPEEDWYTEYADRLTQMTSLLASGFDSSSVNILLAHVFVLNAQTSGSERAVHVAKPYAVSAQCFPADAHYIALGHLHRPQPIVSRVPCAYAGSPLQLDFGEQDQQKSVALIDAAPRSRAHVEVIPLTKGRRLRDVTGSLTELKFLPLGNDYLRVTVKAEAPLPGLADHVREILPNAIDVRIEYPRQLTLPPQDTAQLSPFELFNHYHILQKGIPATDEVKSIFQKLYDEVLHEAG